MLSIVTVTKDDLDGIVHTVESTRALREQREVEQIIVDGSNQENAERIRKIASEEKGVRYSWQTPSGISSAFNCGLRLSTKEWIWFLNGGDEAHPSLNIPFLLYLLTHSDAQAIIFKVEITPPGIIPRHPPLWKLWPPTSFTFLPQPSTLFRRSVLAELNGFKEEYRIGMDGELWIRLFGSDKSSAPDLVSIPLARFSRGGISEDWLNLSKEVSQILWRHRALLFKRFVQNAWMVSSIWGFHYKILLKRFLGMP
jgi:glycosyltransferase involved in cell wall biosynthesis